MLKQMDFVTITMILNSGCPIIHQTGRKNDFLLKGPVNEPLILLDSHDGVFQEDDPKGVFFTPFGSSSYEQMMFLFFSRMICTASLTVSTT